jgi:hypothetical protein
MDVDLEKIKMDLEEIGCKGKDWVHKMGSSNKFINVAVSCQTL